MFVKIYSPKRDQTMAVTTRSDQLYAIHFQAHSNKNLSEMYIHCSSPDDVYQQTILSMGYWKETETLGIKWLHQQ